MDVCVGAAGEAFKEVGDELGLQVADETGTDFRIYGVGGAAAEVDGGYGQGFVHGHEEVAGAIDAAFVADGAGDGFAECNADVFYGVVLVNIQVATAGQVKIEAAVARE